MTQNSHDAMLVLIRVLAGAKAIRSRFGPGERADHMEANNLVSRACSWARSPIWNRPGYGRGSSGCCGATENVAQTIFPSRPCAA